MKDFEQFLNEFKVKSNKIWRVHEGKLIIANKKLTIIPEEYIYDEVNGDFSCRRNELTSLEGCPEIVHGDFDCDYNKLTSLEYCPKEVYGDFYCIGNEVQFSKEDVKAVSKVKGRIFI